jgi:hypothetical protein
LTHTRRSAFFADIDGGIIDALEKDPWKPISTLEKKDPDPCDRYLRGLDQRSLGRRVYSSSRKDGGARVSRDRPEVARRRTRNRSKGLLLEAVFDLG